jgi:energy-coupling factor transporter ATP-binding protein EcfA2
MTFRVRITNVGKLADAEIRIGGFTVLAGPNNTGKSFVSKFLYSIFNAMNANHAETHMSQLITPIKRNLQELTRWLQLDDDDSPLHSLTAQTEKMQSLVKGIVDVEAISEAYPSLLNLANNMQETAANIRKLPTKKLGNRPLPRTLLKNSLDSVTNSLAELKQKLNQTDARNFIVDGIQYEIRQNLLENFQVPTLTDLRGEEKAPSEVNVENFGKFRFTNGEIEFDIKRVWIRQLQEHSRVIYLESPAYWKLKSALEDTRNYRPLFYRMGREQLSGVPGYFYDLVRALKFEYTGDLAFPDVYERLTGNDVIGGKIAISESGNWSFQEKGRSFSLPVTAMGIANLGILALLIERKVLDEDAFIFIDEPEAHLHPAWQVIMAETLFELSRRGVQVVIATHSVDILKWLEVHVKKNPADEERIALNRFPPNADGSAEDFETQIGKIKQELTQPFSNLYMKGL